MQKLPLRERRYKALLNQIARLTLARNKAIKTIVKAETLLPGLERRARRLEFPTVRAKAEKPNGDLPAGAEPIGNASFKLKMPTSPTLERHEGGPAIPVVTKPKRARKPKLKAHPIEQMLGEALSPNSDDRKAKMEALGFRKV